MTDEPRFETRAIHAGQEPDELYGAVPGPMDSYLALRGLKTLAIRMEAHCRNARAIVAYLAEHP